MIERLLPRTVVAAETHEDMPTVLTAAEQAETLSMRPARRAEFATGRHCARRALDRLGYPDHEVRRGARGAPVWPAGIVGSITHCRGYRGAVVAPRSEFEGVGIDAEPHLGLPAGVLDSIAHREELLSVAAVSRLGVHADRVLFCAKEAVFKAWHPLTGGDLVWRDLRVVLTAGRSSAAGTFLALPGPPERRDLALERLAGRWRIERGLILTSAVIAPAPAPAARRG